MSKLTDLQLKSNRMLYPGNVSTFQWYFTGAHAFGGISRKLRSFSATEPIFQKKNTESSNNISVFTDTYFQLSS